MRIKEQHCQSVTLHVDTGTITWLKWKLPHRHAAKEGNRPVSCFLACKGFIFKQEHILETTKHFCIPAGPPHGPCMFGDSQTHAAAITLSACATGDNNKCENVNTSGPVTFTFDWISALTVEGIYSQHCDLTRNSRQTWIIHMVFIWFARSPWQEERVGFNRLVHVRLQ